MDMLRVIEKAHRERCGTERHFCYMPTKYGSMYRLSIVEEGEAGHFPLSEDYFLGSYSEMSAEAGKLNRERLNLSSHQAALIVASSMVGVRRK